MALHLLAVAAALAAPTGSEDVVLELPRSNYRIAFAAANGGCLSSVVDTISGLDVLAAPLSVGIGGALCTERTSLTVLYRNATALQFSASNGLSVAVAFDGPVARITHAFNVTVPAGTAAVALRTPPEHEYAYIADGASSPTLGPAQRDLSVLCVSNWEFGLACAGGSGGCGLTGRAGGVTDLALHGAPLQFTLTFERLI